MNFEEMTQGAVVEGLKYLIQVFKKLPVIFVPH